MGNPRQSTNIWFRLGLSCPTLTMVALANCLAKHLREQVFREPVTETLGLLLAIIESEAESIV
jgi:hypothetical protein